MMPQQLAGNLKVPMVTALGIFTSYSLKDIHLAASLIVLVLSAAYTIRRWYLMERDNRKNGNK